MVMTAVKLPGTVGGVCVVTLTGLEKALEFPAVSTAWTS